MKKFGAFLLIYFSLITLPVFGAYYGNIPQTTLQIAKDSAASLYTNSVHSNLVRVGIGSQNFSTYEWGNVSIYGTGEFEIYNNKTYIDTYDSNNVINVSMVGKIFVLKDAKKERVKLSH